MGSVRGRIAMSRGCWYASAAVSIVRCVQGDGATVESVADILSEYAHTVDRDDVENVLRGVAAWGDARTLCSIASVFGISWGG